jgi:hypothetical protein
VLGEPRLAGDVGGAFAARGIDALAPTADD